MFDARHAPHVPGSSGTPESSSQNGSTSCSFASEDSDDRDFIDQNTDDDGDYVPNDTEIDFDHRQTPRTRRVPALSDILGCQFSGRLTTDSLFEMVRGTEPPSKEMGQALLFSSANNLKNLQPNTLKPILVGAVNLLLNVDTGASLVAACKRLVPDPAAYAIARGTPTRYAPADVVLGRPVPGAADACTVCGWTGRPVPAGAACYLFDVEYADGPVRYGILSGDAVWPVIFLAHLSAAAPDVLLRAVKAAVDALGAAHVLQNNWLAAWFTQRLVHMSDLANGTKWRPAAGPEESDVPRI